MTESTGTEEKGIRITLEEVAGAVGDFGTIFPILLGVAIVCPDVNVSHFFLFLAAWFVIAGLYYRLPVPIEPMKAIGAIVIAVLLLVGGTVLLGAFGFIAGLGTSLVIIVMAFVYQGLLSLIGGVIAGAIRR